MREQLASLEPEQWSTWMRYLFENSILRPDGVVEIPADLVTRWKYQIETDYTNLSEDQKESDRAEADKVLHIIQSH